MPERIHVSGNPAAQLWKKVMTPVHDGLPWEAFTYPYLGENTGIFGYDDSTLTDDDYLDSTDSENNYGDGTSSSRDNYIPGGNSDGNSNGNSSGNSNSGTVNDPYSDNFLSGGGGRMSW